MKYVIALLLIFSAFLDSHQLLALDVKSEIQRHLECSWNSDEKQLYVNIATANDIEFSKPHHIYKYENGFGCKITCRPVKPVFSSEGKRVSLITVEFIVTNIEGDNSCVRLCRKTTIVYRSGWLTPDTFKLEQIDVILNPSINLEEKPYFITFQGGECIAFTNSSPYSDTPNDSAKANMGPDELKKDLND